MDAGWVVLDVRDSKSFALEHIPGSLNVPLSIEQLAGRVPWLIRPDQDILLVTENEEQTSNTVLELGAIRPFSRIAQLAGGLEGWKAQGGLTGSTAQLTVKELSRLLEEQE